MEKGSMAAVYFDRLQTDAVKPKARPELGTLYNIAMSNYKELSGEKHGFGGYAAILNMANAEAAKEQQMLRTIFGVDIDVDLKQPGAIKQLTEAINEVLHFKSIYERNRDIILSEEFQNSAQKGAFSYFGSYFSTALNQYKDAIGTSIVNRMKRNMSLEASEAGKAAINYYMPKIVEQAVTKMFTSNPEFATMDNKHKQAYAEILNSISNFSSKSSNVFINRLYKIFKIDNIMKSFSTALKGINDPSQARAASTATINKIRNEIVPHAQYQKMGYSLEALVDQALALTADGLNGIGNSSIQTSTSAQLHADAGAKGGKADNVLAINVDAAVVDKTLQQIGKNKQEDVNAFRELGQYLENVQNGFLIYVNDKNYSLNENFKGFSAGESVNLLQLKGLLSKFMANIDQVIYNILQNGKGAIMAGDTEGASKVIAEGVAYFLFDDYDTIGRVSTGGQGIHIMNLQGMMIPLSAFLFALGTAIRDVETNSSAYVNVSINAPAVHDSDEFSYGMPNWGIQYWQSMRDTQISIHFMKEFTTFVSSFL